MGEWTLWLRAATNLSNDVVTLPLNTVSMDYSTVLFHFVVTVSITNRPALNIH